MQLSPCIPVSTQLSQPIAAPLSSSSLLCSRVAIPCYPGQQLSHRVAAPLSSSLLRIRASVLFYPGQQCRHRVAVAFTTSQQRSRAAIPPARRPAPDINRHLLRLIIASLL